MSRLLGLGDPEAREPARAGWKAARLAAATAAGLRVLPGFVVPAPEAEGAVRCGARALPERGSGAARLAITESAVDAALLDEICFAGSALGDRLVVRSSSPAERHPSWAGAFASYLDVGVEDLPVALRGCWASIFSSDVLERCRAMDLDPQELASGVLVQPYVEPSLGGTARLEGDGSVIVVGVKGSPAEVTAGWAVGIRARVGPDGTIEGDFRTRLDPDVTRRVAELARAVGALLGDNFIEWAQCEGRVFLFQAGRAPPVPPQPMPPALGFRSKRAGDVALRVARIVARFPGRRGETFILPWALGMPEIPSPGSTVGPLNPDLTERRAREMAAALTADAWGLPMEEAQVRAADAIAALRGPNPDDALEELAMLRPIQPEEAAELLSRLGSVAVPAQHEEWVPSGTAPIEDWEPLLYRVVGAFGRTAKGTPVSPGFGAGPLAWLSRPEEAAAFKPRDVLAAPFPLAAFAPLLWQAAGLITLGGGAGAHLIQVARSLGVPAVAGVELHNLFDLFDRRPFVNKRTNHPALAAVDGGEGTVSVMEV